MKKAQWIISGSLILASSLLIFGLGHLEAKSRSSNKYPLSLQLLMTSYFSPEEMQFLGDQDALLEKLVAELEANPDLLESLPADMAAELKRIH